MTAGFGGSADSRTSNMHGLQLALLQHQQCGVLEVPGSFPACTPSQPGSSLPLTDNLLSQPEAWVRGAIIVRLNSLMRGHSGVRWHVLEAMANLLRHNITPVVPLRGSISASGDLSPLSYVAGCLAGQPGIWAWVDGPEGTNTRVKVPSDVALARYNLEPIVYAPKEALGLLNGTAFSAAVGALAAYEASMQCMLTQVTTAMTVEAMVATDASFAPFIHDECRPHPGQIETASTILEMLQGSKLATHMADERHQLLSQETEGSLRQDRYPLRTSPQWIGPQLEDILAGLNTIVQEMNSTTDNPLVDVDGDHVHHGGNFQAMAVTNAMEKIRLSLQAFGKLTFQQQTELINPSMNRGLPANLAATDPSLNFHSKGIDIGLAAVTSELGYLANPVSTHVQSAEMANQAVNSLALISARYTIQAIETLSMLQAWSIYNLCQAFDLRALQRRIAIDLHAQIQKSISQFFSTWINEADQKLLAARVFARLNQRLDETSARDLHSRLSDAYMQAGYELLQYFVKLEGTGPDPLRTIMAWRNSSADETYSLYRRIVDEYLANPTACYASPLLGRSRKIYEFVRRTLKVPMHGQENNVAFKDGLKQSLGGYVSVIFESLRNGDFYAVLTEVLKDVKASAPEPVARL